MHYEICTDVKLFNQFEPICARLMFGHFKADFNELTYNMQTLSSGDEIFKDYVLIYVYLLLLNAQHEV